MGDQPVQVLDLRPGTVLLYDGMTMLYPGCCNEHVNFKEHTHMCSGYKTLSESGHRFMLISVGVRYVNMIAPDGTLWHDKAGAFSEELDDGVIAVEELEDV